MPSWGTVLGFIFGFLAFRIPGAILGAVVGYLFDKGYAQDFNQSGGFGRFFTSQDAMKQQAIFSTVCLLLWGTWLKQMVRSPNTKFWLRPDSWTT